MLTYQWGVRAGSANRLSVESAIENTAVLSCFRGRHHRCGVENLAH
jgi:hypothetical protein